MEKCKINVKNTISMENITDNQLLTKYKFAYDLYS